jgi:hypothetical protein
MTPAAIFRRVAIVAACVAFAWVLAIAGIVGAAHLATWAAGTSLAEIGVAGPISGIAFLLGGLAGVAALQFAIEETSEAPSP